MAAGASTGTIRESGVIIWQNGRAGESAPPAGVKFLRDEGRFAGLSLFLCLFLRLCVARAARTCIYLNFSFSLPPVFSTGAGAYSFEASFE